MEGEPSHSESASPGNKEKLSESQRKIQNFWPSVMREMQQLRNVEPGNQLLPLARIKKIMKLDEDVKMISSDAPLLFAKGIEIFIHELTLRAWLHTEHNKRRTLQRSDIAMAITKYDQFDFLIDIVPREEIKLTKRSYDVRVSPSGGIENVQYYLTLAQQHQQAPNQQTEQQPEQEKNQESNQEQQQSEQQVVTTEGVTATPVKAVAMAVMGLNPTTTTAAATKTITTATAAAAAITSNVANTIVQLKQTNLQQTLQSTSSQQSRQQKPLQGLQAISILNTSSGSSGNSSASTTSSTATIPTINQPLQLVQHFIAPTGEITQIPITIPPNQLNFIRTAVPVAGGTGATNGAASVQPIFLPATSALQATPTFIHGPPGCMYFSASQLQQFQQQQQQQ